MKTAITDKQKAAIHALVSSLGWPRRNYELWIYRTYGVNSCLAFDSEQADQAIAELRAIEAETMITQKQINFIRYLWLSVDYAECAQGSTLLNNFLRHKYNVESVEKLSKKQAFGCIAAIKRMQAKASGVKIDTSGNIQWITLVDGSRVPAITNPNLQ